MIQTLDDIIRRVCDYGLELKYSSSFTHNWYTPTPALELDQKTSIHSSTVKHHANQSIDDAFVYAIKKWDKIHKTPELKVGDLILVSTLNFDNIRSPKRLKHSFSELFIIKALHGKNAVQVGPSGELENKNTAFPVNLLNHYTSSDK
ncbi:hypothetical protein O181_073424 [Austropuccinia psidii MF-1]|uniref:Uncharacterized protein n=1 Tax=Austropuccinia psidii MF-1 TaxID=1389203 RepID=A0A9Q3ICF5_9BASI|nr:hypothetical protein [Austropuccinia psidii MF-1]